MLQKWKIILTNWINCYSSEDSLKEQNVTTESLLSIISHLREINLNLDESKSSILEAQTIEEFICEKYPGFKFGDGTLTPRNEEEVHIVASLLLYFVCVNSKDVDIKTAMCSKLNVENQETILKFSKCLMECSPVSYRDVQSAITEACSPELVPAACMDPSAVSETPPALRSLHGEVRRLQAALDAERFDRNYLQEELARTTTKIEKLLKDKEEYKQEIVGLKAQISACCGHEAEARGGGEGSEGASRLASQLQDSEDRLITVQGLLDDLGYERDTCKAKIEELKHERDKWLSASEREAARAAQLSEELELERRSSLSLRELVAELRQHQQKNFLDTSQLECDDPDASLHSINNASICNEACANVVEVQLGEERARIVLLQQQIQSLQDQLQEFAHKTENDKKSFESILSGKENDILNLKHRINEEIEEKNNLKSHFNDEFIKLNNEINELEQKINDMNENSRFTIQQKMDEIKTLQEEKLSLLQSLSDETTKLENIIINLKTDIDTEKNLKLKMKEDYEDQMMKLKDKVLNRNNELVELQNNVFQKSEMIEQLYLDLRNEKDMREQLANKYHQDIAHLHHERKSVEQNLSIKIEEANELQRRLLQNVKVFEEFNKEVEDLKEVNSNLSKTLDEKNAIIETLATQLQDELNYKTGLQIEISQLQQQKTELSDEIHKLNNEMGQLKTDIHDKDRVIYALDLYLKEEKHSNKTLNQDCESKLQEIKALTEEINKKNNDMLMLQKKLESEYKLYEEEIKTRDEMIAVANEKLASQILEKDSLQSIITVMRTEKQELDDDLRQRSEEMLQLKVEYENLLAIADKNSKLIDVLEKKLETENDRYMDLQNNFDSQTSGLMMKLNETEKAIKEYNSRYRNTMEEKELQLQTWKLEVERMQKVADNDMEIIKKIENEKEALELKLGEEISYRDKFEKEYLNQCVAVKSLSDRMNAELLKKNEEISALKQEIESLTKTVAEKCQNIDSLQAELMKKKKLVQDLALQKNVQAEELQKKIQKLTSLNHGLESEFRKEIAAKAAALEKLEKDKKHLVSKIEQNTSHYEQLLKEKDNIMKSVEKKLKHNVKHLESFLKETFKVKDIEKYEARDNDITKLKPLIDELKHRVTENMAAAIKTQENLKLKVEHIDEEMKHLEVKNSERLTELAEELSHYKLKVTESERDNSILKEELGTEKNNRDSLLSEISGLTNQNKDLQEKIVQEQKSLTILNDEKNILLKENCILSGKLDEKIKASQTLEQDKEALMTEKDALSQDRQHLLDRLEDEARHKENFTKEKDDLLQQLSNIITEKEKITQDKEQLTQQIIGEVEAKTSLKQETDLLTLQLKHAIESKNIILEENHNSFEKLQNELSAKESLIEENQCLSQQLIDEIEKKSQLQQEVGGLHLKLNIEVDAKRTLQQNLELLELHLNEANTAKNNLQYEIERLELQLNEEILVKAKLQQDIERLEQQLNDEITAKLASQEEVKHALQKLNEELALKTTLQRDIEKLEQRCQEQIEAKTTLEQDIERLKENLIEEIAVKAIEDLKLKLSAAIAAKTASQQDVKRIELELNKVLATEVTLQENIKRLELKLNEEIMAKTASQENIEQIKLQMNEEIASRVASHQDFERLEVKINEEITARAASQQDIGRLEEKLNEELATKTNLQHGIEQLELELNEEIATKVILQQDIEQLGLRLNEEIAVRAASQQDVERLERKLDEELTSKTNLQHNIEQLELKLDAYHQDIEQLQLKLNEEITTKAAAQQDIERLEVKLQEEVDAKRNLLEEKEKLSMKIIVEIEDKGRILEEKEQLIANLTGEIATINAQLNDKNLLIEQLNEKADSLIRDNERLSEKIDEEIEAKCTSLIKENNYKKQLHDAIASSVTVSQEKEALSKAMKDENDKCNSLLDEKETVMNQLLFEITTKKRFEQENTELCERIEVLQQKLAEEHQMRDNIEKVRNSLDQQKNDLIQDINSLNLQLIDEATVKDFLQEEKAKLLELLEEEKLCRGEIYNEKECLLDENETLKHSITEYERIQESLTNEKEALCIDLNNEKAARDELESEKGKLVKKIDDLNEKRVMELNDKQRELDKIVEELQQLNADIKKHEESYAQISSVLNSGLETLLENVRKDNIGNKDLLKLLDIENGRDVPVLKRCGLLVKVAENLSKELMLKKSLEKSLMNETTAANEMKLLVAQKDAQILALQTDVKQLELAVQEYILDISNKADIHNEYVESTKKEIHKLQLENRSLTNDLNDVKVQLEVKVHSLKEKLVDNENLTDKLKRTYEDQINNLNVMITKLTDYLKDKTVEVDTLRKDKDRLQQIVDSSCQVIKTLQEDVKNEKDIQEQLTKDFESRCQVLENMVTVTESVMEDQKVGLNKVISEHVKDKEIMQEEINALQTILDTEKAKDKDAVIESLFKEMSDLKYETSTVGKEMEREKEELEQNVAELKQKLDTNVANLIAVEAVNKESSEKINKYEEDISRLEEKNKENKSNIQTVMRELFSEVDLYRNSLMHTGSLLQRLRTTFEVCDRMKVLADVLTKLEGLNCSDGDKNEYNSKLEEIRAEFNMVEEKAKTEFENCIKDNINFANIIEDNKNVISKLEQQLQQELDQNMKIRENGAHDRLNLENKCSILEEYQSKAEKELERFVKEVQELEENAKQSDLELNNLRSKLNECESQLATKEELLQRLQEEKDCADRELQQTKQLIEKQQEDIESKARTLYELRQKLEDVKHEAGNLLKENDEMIKFVGQRETMAVAWQEQVALRAPAAPRSLQVSTPTSDLTQSSLDSVKTISDLERIVQDKNYTITSLQGDLAYMKNLLADSEYKLLDVTKELEMSKENCQQLASQLKKIVHQKNEEIADLARQVGRMSAAGSRASQIVRVSAKYHAMILRRVAEIKSTAVLRELTNLGGTAGDAERRSLAGAITMEDLESFLETADRHLRRCGERQQALQRDRDRLAELNRIAEAEALNLRKFLTELAVGLKTLGAVKEVYDRKLGEAVAAERAARRDVLGASGGAAAGGAAGYRLERAFAAAARDLAECALAGGRWHARCVARVAPPDRLLAVAGGTAEPAAAPDAAALQCTSLEVQLAEVTRTLRALSAEAARAAPPPAAPAPPAPPDTVQEVRAEYEDKLSRMKARMKELYQEQITLFKKRQAEEVAKIEEELLRTRQKLSDSSRAYEDHIRALTTELWKVGENFLMKQDEADWLRKRSGSLMSLQHIHSSGLTARASPPRPPDTHSLRSLPTHGREEKQAARALHVSDEEGEVFDNRWLRELSTPQRGGAGAGRPSGAGGGAGGGARLSELRWRNSLCPPHLKSSYPAETQFVRTLDEDELKCTSSNDRQRKEVGITAYKKPGPPTPSKQAGRLSATDSELRESIRVETAPGAAAARKTGTPSRLRALFRSGRADGAEGTPRTRRLSNIFRKK